MAFVHTMLELNNICLILFRGTIIINAVTFTKAQDIHYHRQGRRLADAGDTTGFISIDCGTNASYTDDSTTLYYTPDEPYIDSGINMDILPEHKSENLKQQLTNVRSFPEGTKNCYTLRPAQGKGRNYLIRAYFMYGNYDSLNEPPTFNLLLGVDVWDTVKLENSSHFVTKEIIHTPSTDYLYVCLANTDSGTPFMSGLELRHLTDSIYRRDFGSLVLLYRSYVSSTLLNSEIRYKDDVFDRIWIPEIPISASFIETMSKVDSNPDFSLPSSVMKTAFVPKSLGQSIELYQQASDKSTTFYFFLHVAEILSLQVGEVREFNIFINGLKESKIFKPLYLQTTTIFNQEPITDSYLHITIQKTMNSTLPPIVNAIEMYNVKNISELSTDEADVFSINNIKSFYKRMKDWQGDPCFPKGYSWAGVDCNYGSSNSTRIISLNLSSKGLTGHIAASFADLTALQILDLSNNNLSGQIPELLTDLPLLKTLNLSVNNFTGSVPKLLLEKSAAGSLSLSMQNNSGLCSSNSCTSMKKNKTLLAHIAAFSSLLVLIVAGFIIFCIHKKKTARMYERQSPNHNRSGNGRRKGEFTRFAYSELTSMTKGFQRELGKGGFGVVYYGCLKDGMEVAVKMLSGTVDASQQFTTEVELLMDIRHKNLVSLVGYCEEGTTLALVYEYMAGGNLQTNILASESLTWRSRLQIAIDAAQGCPEPKFCLESNRYSYGMCEANCKRKANDEYDCCRIERVLRYGHGNRKGYKCF